MSILNIIFNTYARTYTHTRTHTYIKKVALTELIIAKESILSQCDKPKFDFYLTKYSFI